MVGAAPGNQGKLMERQHCEGVDVHTQSSEEQSIRKQRMQRDPCSTPQSAILIPTSEPAASVWVFHYNQS